MRKIYSLMLAMLVSVASFAQITKVTYGGNDYEVAGTQTLTILEPAATAYAGHTADFSAQLAVMLETVGLEAASATSFVQVDPTGAGFAYNANDGWHAADGTIQGKTWGSEDKLVCIKPWNGADDSIDGTINYIGCIDETWAAGETHKFYCAAINAGKAALLEIVVNFFDASKITYNDASYEVVATTTLELKEKPKTAYSGSTASFADQLAEMLQAVGLSAITNANLIQVDNANNGFAYNTNDGWHAANGAIQGKTWGSEDKLVCVKPWNNEDNVDGTISYIGCIDELWEEGEQHVCRFAAINDGKAAILEVVITFTDNDEPEREPEPIADPVMKLSELEIVKEYEYTMTFKEGKSDDKTIEIDMSDLTTVLGTSEYSIADNIEKIFLTQPMVTDDAGSSSFSDDLIASRFGTDGWFGRYTSYDEATDVETAIVRNAPHGWGGGATFYVQSPKFKEGTFSLNVGAYAGTMTPEDADYAELYIVNGSKAAKLTLKAEIQAIETVDFSQMTKVGEQVIDAKALEVAGQYTSVIANFDAEAIIALLGEDVEEYIHYNYGDEEYSTVVDADVNDYWQSETGISQAWSTSPCCQVTLDLAKGEATLLQMANKYIEIEEAKTFPMYYILAKGSNYYLLKFNFTLKPVGKIDVETECVATEVVTKQIVPDGGVYDVPGRYVLDKEYLESIIGTSDLTIYGDKYNATTEKIEMTKSYTCYDTANKGWGFWYGTNEYQNEEGQVVVTDEGWGCASTNAFGFQLFPDYTIGFFQYPGHRQAGDAYTANIYLMNEANGKYIKFVVNVKYVEEIAPEAETVGEEEVYALADAPEADGTYKIAIDMSKAYEALEMTAEEIEAAEIVAPASQFTMYNYGAEEDITYDVNGYATVVEDRISCMANLSIEDEKPIIIIDPMDNDMEADNTDVIVRIGIEYNSKRYIHIIHLVTKLPDAIASTKANVANAVAIYTVAGAKVNSLKTGVNIVKMSDGSVQKIMK